MGVKLDIPESTVHVVYLQRYDFFLLMKATHTQGKYRRDDLSVVNGSSRLKQKSPEATCLGNGSIQGMSCKHVSQIEVMLEWFPMILVSSTSMWGGYGHCLV